MSKDYDPDTLNFLSLYKDISRLENGIRTMGPILYIPSYIHEHINEITAKMRLHKITASTIEDFKAHWSRILSDKIIKS